MATLAHQAWLQSIKSFSTTEDFEKAVARAVQIGPKNKATGTDEIFVEALNITSEVTRKILSKLWKKYGFLKQTLKDWATALLTPIYKKGDHAHPKSYRPITLLSHARKVIKLAVAVTIRE